MLSELGAVVEGNGSTQARRQVFEQVEQAVGPRLGRFVGLAAEALMAGGALVGHQHGLPLFSEEPEIDFLVAGDGPVVGLSGPLVNGHAAARIFLRASPSGLGTTCGAAAVGPVVLLGRAVTDEPVD
ncbi:MAG: hypothetical protein LAO04_14720 [Acidobacteriia bacterium]|nr:hypothetical protein [Terriglobia bacterium]